MPPEPNQAELRSQLILAQVRLMELEDERDALRARLDDTQSLLAAGQQRADESAAHATRAEATARAASAREAALASDGESLRSALSAAEKRRRELEAQLEDCRRRLDAAEQAARTMQASRSWRWTRWLRAIEKFGTRR